jgi:hypothetical protein
MKKLMLALAFVAACGASQKEIAVQGSDLDLARIAGDWAGQYTGTESGRSGQVSFSLQVGSHVAEGQVVMNGATPLKVEFVKIKEDQVKGTIAPYTDPACSCQVETTFIGDISDNLITGSFETKISANGQTQTGTWSVSRHKS